MFDADIDLFDDTDQSSSNRKFLQKVLGDNAQYLKLKNKSKTPDGSFAKGRRNRLKNIPKTGNYGIIPHKKLFILDFDCHNEGFSTIDEQIDFFSEFFEVNLRKSFAVVTPTGGIHVYLMFPEDISETSKDDFPKASLRGYSKAFSEVVGREIVLDADIRSGLVNGYVVGVESLSSRANAIHDKYWIADHTVGFSSEGFDILSVPQESMGKFKQVVSFRNSAEKSLNDKLGENDGENPLQAIFESLDNASGEKTNIKPPTEIVYRLKKSIKAKNIVSYHAKRAFVKSALHCCYDDYAIAIACIEMGIDKDSYNDKSIGFRSLITDIKRFTPEKRYHGFYCYQGRQNLRIAKKQEFKEQYSGVEFNVDEFTKKMKQKISQRSNADASSFRVLNPRVIDIGKVSSAILMEKKKDNPPQQYFDAMAIVDYFIQPLSNVGTSRILLAKTAICERLALSPSRVTQALRLLRENKVIRIEEKQKSGMAPTYSVSESFTQFYLTKALRLAWGRLNKGKPREESDSIYFDRLSGVFRKVFTDEAVETVSSVDEVLRKISLSVPAVSFRSYAGGAAVSYLKSEAERYDFSPIVLDDIVVDENTGEIVDDLDFIDEFSVEKLTNESDHLTAHDNSVIMQENKVEDNAYGQNLHCSIDSS